MASFLAKFSTSQIKEPLIVQTCTYHFKQPIDHKGRPSAGVRSALIKLTLLGEDRGALTQWAIDPLKAVSGKIVYLDLDGSTFRTVTFQDAYLVRYYEVFTPGSTVSAYRFDIGLTARRMAIDDTEHDNMWLDWKPGL